MSAIIHMPRRLPPTADPRFLLAITGLMASLLAGCAQFNYDRVRLGQTQREYQRAFPDEGSRRTTAGIGYMARDWTGRTDAAVVLLTADRRVSGKLYASFHERTGWLNEEVSYRLVGELDPTLIAVSGAGPIDALRAVADELTTTDSDQFARDAQAWVAAGLVRLVQHWPHVGDEGPAITRLTETLERVPSGGEARITISPRGVYLVEYTVRARR